MAEYREITKTQELSEVLKESCQRKIILFKHSTTCPISARAWGEVQNYIRESSDEVLVVMIKVIEARPVSNLVTETLGVQHQSPQLLLLENNQVLWHVSHQQITQDRIKKALDGSTQPQML